MKSIKIFLGIYFLIFISCSLHEKSCGEIVRKYIQDDNYFFAMKAFGGNSDADDVYGDVEITKEIYNSFEIGDQYCVD